MAKRERTLGRFPGARERAPGVWELRAQLPPDGSGRYHQKSKTHHGDERSARQALTDLERDAAAGKFSRGTSAPGTVAELLESFIESRRRRWSANHLKKTRSNVALHLDPAFGRHKLDALTTLTIERTYHDWADRGVGSPTIARCHAVLRAAYNYALRHDWVDRNPAAHAELDTAPTRRPANLTIADVARAIRIAATGAPADPDRDLPALRPTPAMATVIRVAANTGARRGELAALRWQDVDLTAGTISITSALTTAGGVERKATKAGDDTRSALAIDDGTVEALKAWRKVCLETSLAAGWPLRPSTPVWRNGLTNRPMHPDTMTKAWRKIADHAGISADAVLHDCRHAVGTVLIADGFDPVTVRDRLGHRVTSTTLDLYSHGVQANDRRAADHLGQLLDDALDDAG